MRNNRNRLGNGTPKRISPFSGYKNVVDQSFWFRSVLPAATATNQLTFFNTAPGNKNTTNILTPNMLPGDNDFVIMAIRVDIEEMIESAGVVATATAPGSMALIRRGFLEMKFDDETGFQTLVRDLPGGGGISGLYADGAAQTHWLSHGVPDRRNFRGLMRPLRIRPRKTFSLTISWVQAITTAAAQAIPVIVWLDGFYSKDVAPAA